MMLNAGGKPSLWSISGKDNTFAICLYILGLKKKDAILLRTGFFSGSWVATFRNYYHILPTAVALTILAPYARIAWANEIPSKHPNTDSLMPTDEANALDHLKVESLIIAETSLKPSGPN